MFKFKDEFAMGFFYGTMLGLLVLVVITPEPVKKPVTTIDRVVTLPPSSMTAAADDMFK